MVSGESHYFLGQLRRPLPATWHGLPAPIHRGPAREGSWPGPVPMPLIGMAHATILAAARHGGRRGVFLPVARPTLPPIVIGGWGWETGVPPVKHHGQDGHATILVAARHCGLREVFLPVARPTLPRIVIGGWGREDEGFWPRHATAGGARFSSRSRGPHSPPSLSAVGAGRMKDSGCGTPLRAARGFPPCGAAHTPPNRYRRLGPGG